MNKRFGDIFASGVLLAFIGTTIGINYLGQWILFIFGVTYSLFGTRHHKGT